MTDPEEIQAYLQMVDRGLESIPTYQPEEERHRIDLPELEIHLSRNKTIVQNFELYVSRLRREPKEVLSDLSRMIGFRLLIQQGSLILLTQIDELRVMQLIDEYVTIFVRCPTCEKLDTVLRREGSQRLLLCEVCGTESRIRLP